MASMMSTFGGGATLGIITIVRYRYMGMPNALEFARQYQTVWTTYVLCSQSSCRRRSELMDRYGLTWHRPQMHYAYCMYCLIFIYSLLSVRCPMRTRPSRQWRDARSAAVQVPCAVAVAPAPNSSVGASRAGWALMST